MTASEQVITLPSPQQIEDGAKSLLAVGALVGAVLAICRRWSTRRRAERERRELEAKAIRYLLDATRHALGVIVPHEGRRMIDDAELIRQKILIDQVRDRIWQADGHTSAERQAEEIVNVLTRTQAIKVKQDRQDMFTEGDDR